MSNNNNSEVNGMVFALALIGVAFMYMAIAFAALLSLYSIFMTFVAFWAWFTPRKFIKWTIYPWEARAFVYGGVLGAVVVPILVAIAASTMKFRVGNEYVWPIIIVGYAIGSNISAWITNKMQEEGGVAAEQAKDVTPAIPPSRRASNDNDNGDDDAKTPFNFATWDDEEKR